MPYCIPLIPHEIRVRRFLKKYVNELQSLSEEEKLEEVRGFCESLPKVKVGAKVWAVTREFKSCQDMLAGQFHDQGDNVKKVLLINSNLNHQICPKGGQPPGGR
jgi:hypothetical protein